MARLDELEAASDTTGGELYMTQGGVDKRVAASLLGGSGGGAVDSVNGQTGVVTLDADDIDDTSTAHKFATAAQLANADSATQPGDNVSTLANDAGYITSAPVTSVNSATGVVVLDADDIDDTSTAHKFVTATDIAKLANVPADTNTELAGKATSAQGALADSALQNVVDDTTPQLGGDLDGQGNNATSITRSINAQTGTAYTLVLGDSLKVVTMSNASANTLTIPTNASVAFPVGTTIDVGMLGAGATTVTGDTGVLVNGVTAGGAAIDAQYKAVTITKTATDTWWMVGAHGTVA